MNYAAKQVSQEFTGNTDPQAVTAPLTAVLGEDYQLLTELNCRLNDLESRINGAKPEPAGKSEATCINGIYDNAAKNHGLLVRAISVLDQIQRGLVG